MQKDHSLIFLLFFLLEKYRGPLLGQFPDVSLYKMKCTTQFISKQNKVLVLFQINIYIRILQWSYCFQAKTSITVFHLRHNLGLDASLCLGSWVFFSFQIADLVSLTANRSWQLQKAFVVVFIVLSGFSGIQEDHNADILRTVSIACTHPDGASRQQNTTKKLPSKCSFSW